MTFKLKQGSALSPESSLKWNVLEHSTAIDREVNLYFKPFVIKDVLKTMVPMKLLEGNKPFSSSNIESGIKIAGGPLLSERQENEHVRGRQKISAGGSGSGSGANF